MAMWVVHMCSMTLTTLLQQALAVTACLRLFEPTNSSSNDYSIFYWCWFWAGCYHIPFPEQKARFCNILGSATKIMEQLWIPRKWYVHVRRLCKWSLSYSGYTTNYHNIFCCLHSYYCDKYCYHNRLDINNKYTTSLPLLSTLMVFWGVINIQIKSAHNNNSVHINIQVAIIGSCQFAIALIIRNTCTHNKWVKHG